MTESANKYSFKINAMDAEMQAKMYKVLSGVLKLTGQSKTDPNEFMFEIMNSAVVSFMDSASKWIDVKNVTTDGYVTLNLYKIVAESLAPDLSETEFVKLFTSVLVADADKMIEQNKDKLFKEMSDGENPVYSAKKVQDEFMDEFHSKYLFHEDFYVDTDAAEKTQKVFFDATEEQIESEILGVMKLIDDVYSIFGFEYSVELSTRPENSMGNDADWEMATEALKKALNASGKSYVINEGDGAFYGPKIDFHLKDCLGRTWQCGTIQLDFQLPERFELEYTGKDNGKYRPIMVHRVVLGSIERFIGILIEHYAGAFPLWIAPVQLKMINVSEKSEDYAREVSNKLFAKGYRIENDFRAEKVGYKIRGAQLEKVPYMLIIGENEVANGTVSIRKRNGEEIKDVSLEALCEMLDAEIKNKK